MWSAAVVIGALRVKVSQHLGLIPYVVGLVAHLHYRMMFQVLLAPFLMILHHCAILQHSHLDCVTSRTETRSRNQN